MFSPPGSLWAVYRKLHEPITGALFRVRLTDLGHCWGVSHPSRARQPAETLHICVIGTQCNEETWITFHIHPLEFTLIECRNLCFSVLPLTQLTI